MKISDHLVQCSIDKEEDRAILRTACTPVNIRLYQLNFNYRKVILEIVRCMDEHLNSTFVDYQNPRGVAAPNLGFPLRIIGYKKNTTEIQFCLNPKIIWSAPTLIETTSNCGSVRFESPIKILRHSSIDFEYCDLEGNLVQKRNVSRNEGAFTIQHEIDQINGKLLGENSSTHNLKA